LKLSPSLKLPADFPRFVAAGAVGFIVDSLMVLALVNGAGWRPLPARVISILVAMISTWLINRLWTFRTAVSDKTAASIGAEFVAYCSVQLTGAAASYAVYALVVALIGEAPLKLLTAIAAGSASALAINYFGARIFVFRAKS
jgi:putative flippase GtrA